MSGTPVPFESCPNCGQLGEYVGMVNGVAKTIACKCGYRAPGFAANGQTDLPVNSNERNQEILTILDAEIQWCKENPDRNLSADYQAGFIKGLEQAKYLVTAKKSPKKITSDNLKKGSMKEFPLQVDEKYRGACPTKVDWRIVAAHEKQALRNHGQTVHRLAERGGLAPCELLAVLEDRPWHKMDSSMAIAQLNILLAFEKAKLSAE